MFFNEIILFFYKTALYLAIENENIKIIRLLLKRKDIDVNIKSIKAQLIYNVSILYQFSFNSKLIVYSIKILFF